jgi:hypothetical protein
VNWGLFALKVPSLIQGSMKIVQSIKGASGADKKAAVIASIPAAIDLAEFGAGKDLLNNPAVAQLVGAYIDAEKAAMNAKAALEAGILAHAPHA